jgi:hypothetical protein
VQAAGAIDFMVFAHIRYKKLRLTFSHSVMRLIARTEAQLEVCSLSKKHEDAWITTPVQF